MWLPGFKADLFEDEAKKEQCAKERDNEVTVTDPLDFISTELILLPNSTAEKLTLWIENLE